MNKARAQVVFSLLLLLTCGAIVGYAAIPQNTIRHNQGAVFPTLNATDGYFVGPNMIVSAARAASFVTVDTGQGANELYDMDQNVQTTDDVTFNSIDIKNLFRNTVNKTDVLAYPVTEASYVIWSDGLTPSTYYAKNGTTGQIQFSGTDAATVINAVIDALPVDGGVISLKAVEFTISTPIIIDKARVKLIGEGVGTVLKLADGADCDVIQIGGAGKYGSYTVLAYITIDGNKANQTIAVDGIKFLPSVQIVDGLFSYVTVVFCKGHGISAIDVSPYAWIFENIYSEHNDKSGMYMNQLAHSGIHDIWLYANDEYGFYGGSFCGGNSFSNIHCHGNGLDGFKFYNSKYNTVVGGDAYQNGEIGINLEGCSWNTLNGFSSRENQKEGFLIYSGYENTVNGGVATDNSKEGDNTYSGVRIYYSLRNKVIGLTSKSTAGVRQKWGIEEALVAGHPEYTNYNIIVNNVVNGNAGLIYTSGLNTICRQNVGYVTENSSTATILNTTTSIVVNHGCAYTPSALHVSLTLTNNPTNDPGNLYVDTFTATQMTIRCRNDPGASGAIIAWRIQRIP